MTLNDLKVLISRRRLLQAGGAAYCGDESFMDQSLPCGCELGAAAQRAASKVSATTSATGWPL